MNYWWVNHKQTHRAEIQGGYIWSPTREKNGARSEFYLNLTRVDPGDVIFSYANTKIMAIGVATDQFRESSMPEEFGKTGGNWDEAGWLVPIEWRRLGQPFSPKTHIEIIRDLLPNGYSPIDAKGNGNQKCYLAKISDSLAFELIAIAESDNQNLSIELDSIEVEISADQVEKGILGSNIGETEKEQLIKARIGQGLFRQNVMAIESKCRVTGVGETSFLVASHIKPWRDADNQERLDGNNGLLLSPHVDKLFDGGWITFTSEGEMLLADPSLNQLIQAWGIDPKVNVGRFTKKQANYLEYHRNEIFEGTT